MRNPMPSTRTNLLFLRRRAAALGTVVLVLALAVAGVLRLTGDSSSAPPTGSGSDSSPDPGSTRFVPKDAYLKDACALPPKWVRYIWRGWDASKASAQDIIVVPQPRNYVGTFIYTAHSGPYDYLQRIPMIWYGPGFITSSGHVTPDREVTIDDIAATQAQLLGMEWPVDRPSEPITEALDGSVTRPKLMVTISIDGGGFNDLEQWPETWPTLRRLMEQGTSIDNAVVGSSPSITPAVHTSISTGTYPRFHGVTAIAVRQNDGDIVGAYADDADSPGATVADPTINLRTTTVPDMWDLHTGNEAKIALVTSGNYTLGLVGHGAALEGADKDIVAMHDKEEWATNPTYFSLPEYVNTEVEGPQRFIDATDRMDGKADGKWRGHDIDLDASPAFPPWENEVAFEIMEREGFGEDDVTDLFYMHYKAPDAAGHKYNMIAPEQGDVLASVDAAIGDFIARLDDQVGAGNYALVVTADHGQTPLEQGGWPINRNELRKDMSERFHKEGVDLPLLQRSSSTVLFMVPEGLAANGTTPEAISSFMSRYTIGDNIPPSTDPPAGYEGRLNERIFAAVFPGRTLPKIVSCTGALES
jgi:arylsulfatase A-like enzyme